MSNDLVADVTARSYTFQDKALDDVYKLTVAKKHFIRCIEENKPILFGIVPGDAQECKDIFISGICVLSVLNYYTFPVTAILDSIKLSQRGKLDDALDVRPFMFSGPAPTMVIWSGTNKDRIEDLNYPELSDEDAESAFRYWVRYIFGLNLTETWMLERC